MSHREARNGNVSMTVSETDQPNFRADALAEITFAPLKAPGEPVGGSDLSSHLLGSVQLRLRRDPAEFAAGKILPRENAEFAVTAVSEFFDRHLGPLTRSSSAPVASARK
jgi:hypothetical protein